MTLASVLATHNDTALEGLTSKGLLRRARKDLEAGRVSVIEVSDSSAQVLADGQSVTIDQGGPSAAKCACPASGVCRHILLAILALQDQVNATNGEASVGLTAVNEICALEQQTLENFAGADWEKAVTLVADGEPVEFHQNGTSVTVKLTNLKASVTFICGQSLNNAVYKGTKRVKRLCVTVCAVYLRQREGASTVVGARSKLNTGPNIAAKFLQQAQTTIERAVSAILPGRSVIAHDLFFDLAISTRVEALPRLSSELRGLARQAEYASVRDVAFEPDVFLKNAARAYALLEALKVAPPGNTVFTGTLRRDYKPHASIDLWMLGVARWRSATAARGLSVYAYAPAQKTWFTVNDGRAAGTDLTFEPVNVYYGSLWGAGSLQTLIGKTVHLPEPMITTDGSISSNLIQNATATNCGLSLSELLESDIAFKQWPKLRNELAARFGSGLTRRVMPQSALIAPSGFRGFGFNDFDQVYEWEIIDQLGNALILSIPGNEHETAQRMRQLARRIQALLVEVSIGTHSLCYRPVTVFSEGKSAVDIHNVDFDAWPVRRGLSKTLQNWGGSLSGCTKPIGTTVDPIRIIISDVLDEIVGVLGHSPAVDLEKIRRRCEASGLVSLAGAIYTLQSEPNVKSALRAAYIAEEVEMALLFE